jgi:opacity protein-like surface antigen
MIAGTDEIRRPTLRAGLKLIAMVCALWLIGPPGMVHAEWYVAGQVGPAFADRLSNISGTRFVLENEGEDFDLKNSVTYGAKLGNFPGNGWFGLEGEVFNTTPHIKQLGSDPGIHLRVTTLALNLIARYPGLTYQPYAGLGFGLLFSHLGSAPPGPGGGPGIQSDSDVSSGFNVLAGLRVFVTPYVSVFTEYKYTQATLRFDGALGPIGGFTGDYRAQHLMLGVGYHF